MRAGSNTVVVGSKKSQTGAPIIASDPHLGFVIPNLWVLAGIKSPSLHVVGAMPVGIPIFAFGRNNDLAWGGTNMRQEASDWVQLSLMIPALSKDIIQSVFAFGLIQNGQRVNLKNMVPFYRIFHFLTYQMIRRLLFVGRDMKLVMNFLPCYL